MRKISIPPSKSVTCRALILSALSDSPTVLKNTLDCDDTRFLRQALENFGVKFENLPHREIKVTPPKNLRGNNSDNFIGNAGAPTRFLAALSLVVEGGFSLRGTKRMHERPMRELFDILKKLGVQVVCEGKKGFLPAKFKSPPSPPLIKGGEKIQISGSISSQFLSGLLLVAPRFSDGLEIEISDEIVSAPYVEMTLELLRVWRAKVSVSTSFQHFKVLPGLRSPGTFEIPLDCTSATYPIAFSLLSGEPIAIQNFSKKTFQGDENFLEIVKKFGAKVKCFSDRVEIFPPPQLRAGQAKKLLALGKVNFSEMPDTVMTAAIIAAVADGVSEFGGVENLRFKECDRLVVMEQNLKKLGIEVESGEDFLRVFGNKSPLAPPGSSSGQALCQEGEKIDSFEDHRIVMSFGVLSEALGMNLSISDPECVRKSWPDFWECLAEWAGKLRPVVAVIVERKSPPGPLFAKEGEREFLIVRKPRKRHAWQFPQGGVDEGETLQQAVVRELAEECGQDLKMEFLSSKPVGEYRYFFPKDFTRHEPEIRGASVRFFRVRFVLGDVKIDGKEIVEYEWVKRKELNKYFDQEYLKKVLSFL